VFNFIKNRLRPAWYKLARHGQPVFECPERVRISGQGYREIILVCGK
jgi:hypothetical protein